LAVVRLAFRFTLDRYPPEQPPDPVGHDLDFLWRLTDMDPSFGSAGLMAINQGLRCSKSIRRTLTVQSAMADGRCQELQAVLLRLSSVKDSRNRKMGIGHL
jgi:hypothetical protein